MGGWWRVGGRDVRVDLDAGGGGAAGPRRACRALGQRQDWLRRAQHGLQGEYRQMMMSFLLMLLLLLLLIVVDT